MPRTVLNREGKEVRAQGARYVVTCGTFPHLFLYKKFGQGKPGKTLLQGVYDLNAYQTAELTAEEKTALRPYRVARDWTSPFGPGRLEGISVRPDSRHKHYKRAGRPYFWQLRGQYTVYTGDGYEVTVGIDTTDFEFAEGEEFDAAVDSAISYWLDEHEDEWLPQDEDDEGEGSE